MHLFITIVTAVALGIFIGGVLFNKYQGDSQFKRAQEHIDNALREMRGELIDLLETHFKSQHQFFQTEKADLDDQLRHSLQELVVTLQTVKSYSELDDIRKQETFEWVIDKAMERYASLGGRKDAALIDLLEKISLTLENKVEQVPAAETPVVKVAKRVRKPATGEAKTSKVAKVGTKVEKKTT